MAPNEGRGPSRAPAARVHPLPLSIAVRNLFPPLAPPADGDATTAASGGGGSGPSSSSSAAEAEVDGSSPIRASAPAEEEGEGARRGDRPGVEASARNPSRHRSRIESLSSKISSSSVEERCALVSREVLLRLRLDVVRKPSPSSPSRSGDGAEEADDEKAEGGVSTTAQRETLVYSSEQARSTAHPRWDHLNERLPSSRSALGSLSDVYARFVIADGAEDSSALPAAAEENVGYGRVLAEIPLHPSQLRRLPPTATAGASDYGQKSSGGAMGVPHSLPPNTVLIHYDDGYTRVVPNVYWLLVQRGVIDESVTDPIKRNGSGGYAGIKSEGSNDGEDGGGPSLFEDKAFSVLGEPSASASATGAPPIGADSGEPHDGDGHADGGAQSTLVDDKVFDLLGEAAPATAHVKHAEATPQRSSDKNDESAFDDRILDLLGASAKDVESKEEMAVGVPIETSRDDPPELTAEANKDADAGEAAVDERTSMNLSEEQRKENQEARPEESSALQPVPELPSPPTIDSSEGTRKSQRDEIEELRRLVQLEELMLEEEERQAVQVIFSLFCVCALECVTRLLTLDCYCTLFRTNKIAGDQSLEVHHATGAADRTRYIRNHESCWCRAVSRISLYLGASSISWPHSDDVGNS